MSQTSTTPNVRSGEVSTTTELFHPSSPLCPVERDPRVAVISPERARVLGRRVAPQLSIVIASYDTVDFLEPCLESIYRFPPRVDFEVLVVDNHSPDGSAGMVRERFPQVRLQVLETNIGFARANNLALRSARGRYLLLLNSDTRVLEGSLDGLLAALQRNPDVGVVGCKQLDGNRQLQLTWGRFPTFFSEMVRKVLHWRLRTDGSQVRDYLDRKYHGASTVDWVSGSCLLARREAVQEGGLLDENLFLYFEDIDWCRRIQNEGWRVLYEPGVQIIHYGGVSASRHLIDALVAYRCSQLYFCRKYFGPGALTLLKALVGGKSAVAFVRHSFGWLASVARPRQRFQAYCKLLTLKKILQSLFQRVPRPATGAPRLDVADSPALDVREAS